MKNEKRNSTLNRKTKTKPTNYLYKAFIFSLKIFIVNFIIGENIIVLNDGRSEINLIIEGSGNISFLNNSFKYKPSEVLINGISQGNSCKTICYFEDNITNVTIIYDYQLDTLNPMFKNLKNIKEIDLSNFDSSKVISMVEMFNGCSNLEKIIFGNINTSLVANFNSLFKNCNKLKSIDLSNIDISKVTNMESMFLGCSSIEKINFGNINTSSLNKMTNLFKDCSKLKTVNLSYFDTSKVTNMSSMFSGGSNLRYLDLSNFNTSIVGSTDKMFENCNSLIFLNLGLFQLNISELQTINIFNGISENVKYCIEDNETRYLLLGNHTSNCSDYCFNTDIKLDINNNSCIESCNESGYLYEYNHICSECPEGTYTFFCEGNECNDTRECLDKTPEGYYFDPKDEKYKKCFDNCKFCYGPGNETINNCSECKNNFTFLDDSPINTNCYKKCEHFYFFDDQKNYRCTQNHTCPSKYKKFIKNRNKCIEDCRKDNIYKREYDNNCYSSCPNGTYEKKSSTYFKCYDQNLEGFYLYNEKYEQCFNNCKFCNGPGNETNNNCKECISHYTFLNDSINKENCYKECLPNYYFFDDNNNYNCTINKSCPVIYNKLIEDKNKCVKDCKTDSTYIYNFLNICYDKCPSGTYQLENSEDYICYNQTLEGYYLDISNETFKKCFDNCKFCFGPGNETINNCMECKSNFTFYNNSINDTNCYEICENYYYFDINNTFRCTEDKTCPEEYNQFIEYKKKCIDDCKNDDIYKYEYNNNCFLECPNDTYHEENSTICYKNESGSTNIILNITQTNSESESYNDISESEAVFVSENGAENEKEINNDIIQSHSNTFTIEHRTQTEIATSLEIFESESTIITSENKSQTKIETSLDLLQFESTIIFNENITKLEIETFLNESQSISTIIDTEKITQTDIETSHEIIESQSTDVTTENMTQTELETSQEKIQFESTIITGENLNKTELVNNTREVNNISTTTIIIKDERDKDIETFRGKLSDYNISETKEDIVEEKDGVIYQMTTSDNQKNNSNKNISTINLGDCEKELKRVYNISPSLPLLIFKIDYYSPDTLIPIIGYEIYHPINKSKLDLKYCEDILIQLNIPVTIDESKLFRYDPNSEFYTDNCFSYTTENGTDIILNDRKQEFSDNNLSLCENNCNYTGYNSDNKQSSCDCNVKNKMDLISEIIDNPDKLSNNFEGDETSSTASNIISIKCTKALFSKEGLKNNISSYILLIFIGHFLFSIILFMKCGYPLLNNNITEILQEKEKKLKNNQKKNNSKNQITKEGILRKKKINKTGNKKKNNFPPKKNASINLINNNYNFIKGKGKGNNNKKSILNKKNNNIRNNIMNKQQSQSLRLKNNKIKKNQILNKKSNTIKQNRTLGKSKTNKLLKKSPISKPILSELNGIKNISYNNYELNYLEYNHAILFDKRTCCQYYSSLIAIKNPILFSFCPRKDYNSIIIRTCIFSLSFSIYYATNFVFFNDDILHKIYEEGGKYDVVYFIPKIAISFGVGYLITAIIKFIFLSERNLLRIKFDTANLSIAHTIADKERRNLIIKYVFFFILGIIFLGFFWMLLSSFGAVYPNTQMFIFKNALISFAMALVYPFFSSIFPCILRMASLSSKNSECLFKLSKFFQVL